MVEDTLSKPEATVSLLHPVESDVRSGPRRQLSPVVRSLYVAADRHNLVEQSLEEELKQLGDEPSLQLATSLMQLGVFRHMRDRPANALPVLARAEEMFRHLQGENAPSTATVLGGSSGGQAGAGGLASMLDMNRDGNPLDDILRMAGKGLR